MGILRLSNDYGHQRLEAACHRALIIGGVSYRSVASILKHSLDQKSLAQTADEQPTIIHQNIRGHKYYH
jgi:3-deoxy-D-manno-octulosonic-acid transferase